MASQIWKIDLGARENTVFPEIVDDKVVFKKLEKSREDLSPQQLIAAMVEQFAQAYKDSNAERPTFFIHSKSI